jgi:hypothetical protein
MQYKFSEFIKIVKWENEVLVYHAASGVTHLFTDSSEKLLHGCFYKIFCLNDLVELCIPIFNKNIFFCKNTASDFLNDLLNKDLIMQVS